MSKHTPGPWYLTFLGNENDGEAGLKTQVGSSILYAKFISKADASLISAAPDLLQCLEWMMAIHQSKSGIEYCAALNAIARAKGESQ